MVAMVPRFSLVGMIGLGGLAGAGRRAAAGRKQQLNLSETELVVGVLSTRGAGNVEREATAAAEIDDCTGDGQRLRMTAVDAGHEQLLDPFRSQLVVDDGLLAGDGQLEDLLGIDQQLDVPTAAWTIELAVPKAPPLVEVKLDLGQGQLDLTTRFAGEENGVFHEGTSCWLTG